eukprot:gnl/MRDRNA2_/MRDRNA2_107324_c0_seq1.p1 gnl/MRDRNA2_/MRDRNA2_107324_c0~~gnl/MRDRNA2_/MRDRNA2_107324_c0_seq1.p1  ORF type:complete len:221 (+),score=32.90 gnl/MRDRNA2_/MRDRNA2_107324_c0_seq1:109-771(+)
MQPKSQIYVQQIAGSQSTGSLQNNRSTASLASATSIISDSSAPTAVPQRSIATAMGGESLQPYLPASVGKPAHHAIPASAGPNVTYNAGHASASGPPPSRPGVLHSHQQTAPAAQKVQYVAGPQHQPQQTARMVASQQTSGPHGAPPYRPADAQPIWVIEEVVDFGVPVDELDNSLFLKDVNCFAPQGCRKGRKGEEDDGIFATCMKPACKSPELCPVDE